MKKTKNNFKGITLVALVITIILLLILAGISISALTNTGIFEKVKQAKEKSEAAKQNQESLLAEYEVALDKYTSNAKWDGKVNKPELMTGMTAIKFTEPTDSTEGTWEITTSDSSDWYEYGTENDKKRWANAQTEDGSMWVWIPRFAYKIIYNDSSDKSKGGKFDVVFLIETTDNYYDKNGKLQTAQRQTTENEKIETDSTKTDKYTVHPAFTDETKIGYANGGWKKELAGIWVSKFEAAYFDKTSEQSKIKASSVNYTQIDVWTPAQKDENARNYYDGIYGSTPTAIKYPTFQGARFSMNYINHGDAFSISKALTENGNIYGLKNTVTDSHLIKNSEWGAIAYLGQSQYGLNGTNIKINNLNVNDNTNYVYAKTGYASKTSDNADSTTSISNVYKWTEKGGTSSSCTGTIYGIYDMSGGIWERVASIINNSHPNLTKYGQSIMNALNNGKSSEYVTVYSTSGSKIYGDAVQETSNGGDGNNSWQKNYSNFPTGGHPFFLRGGGCSDAWRAGLFSFYHIPGNSIFSTGFRSVLVSQ